MPSRLNYLQWKDFRQSNDLYNKGEHAIPYRKLMETQYNSILNMYIED
jgi:hypothetical protein